jgi:hypothetical protein
VLRGENSEDSRVTGGVGGLKRIDVVLERSFMDALRREGVGLVRAL